ncbi:MAG: histidinol dehydrogenase [Candidatus Tyrphobacter sp.]
MRRLPIVESTDRALDLFYVAGWEPAQAVVEAVREIVAAVRARGDDALVEYARRFDDPQFERSSLRAAVAPIDVERRALPVPVTLALDVAKARVKRFHEAARLKDVVLEEEDGTRISLLARPLDSVAAYVPGGSAALISTVLMTVVPAKVAGVRRVAVFTPPQRGGGVDPAMLYACALCEADEVYAAGGAQAIAAAAYGTETIERFDKIVGPGNVWVTEAKRQVAGVCAIDGLAGPSEVLVVLDDDACAELAAEELLAQAEHDPQARVAALSESRAALARVADALERAPYERMARAAIVEGVIANRCRLIHAGSFDELCAAIDRFAPEHLSLRIAQHERVLERVRSAGAIFIGEKTPVACGDYIAGTNHVLPTSGSARFGSGLSTRDFMRTFSVVENGARRMREDAPLVQALAEFEGLERHAVTARLAAERGG